jgi:hypothetical protein
VSHTRQTQATKNGTSNNVIAEELTQNKRNEGLTREEVNNFLNEITDAKQAWIENGRGPLAEIEVERHVIERFNKAGMKDFDDTKYFIYNDVRVYEKGTKEHAKARENMTMEEKLHGRRR